MEPKPEDQYKVKTRDIDLLRSVMSPKQISSLVEKLVEVRGHGYGCVTVSFKDHCCHTLSHTLSELMFFIS